MPEPALWIQQLADAEKRGAKGYVGVGYSECPCEACDARFGTERRDNAR